MIILNYDEISTLLSFELGLDWIKEYFSLKRNNAIIEPHRYNFTTHKTNQHVYLGGASILINNDNVIGYKNINFFKKNFDRYRMSDIFGIISILNNKNGSVDLVADARYITYMRTVATLALFLENRIKPDEKIGIIGAGQMLYYIIGYLTKISNVKNIQIYSKRIENRTNWLNFLEEKFDVSFQVSAIKDIIHQCETLILATNEDENHVIEYKESNRNICALGSISKRYKGEIGLNVFNEVKHIVCDDIELVKEEHGGIKNTSKDIKFYSMLDKIEKDQPLIFRSAGLMSQDIYFAYKLLNLDIMQSNLYNNQCIDNMDLTHTYNFK